MANGSLDLTTLLPSRYRDKTIDSLLKNLFNRHVSKSDTIPLYGFVGDQLDLQPGEAQITETDLERQINQLTPFIYSEHATEKKMASWYDLVQKLVTLGVDYQTINEWFAAKSYNFVPPIDLDKFCNFQEYYWIGKWLLKPTYDVQGTAYTLGTLGLASVHDYHIPAFQRWGNDTFDPEYYVIQRGLVTAYGHPIAPQPTFPAAYSWSDWSYTNLWVHRDDAIRYIDQYGGLIGFSDLVQATRPIIEYSCYVGLNTSQSALGVPTDANPRVMQTKSRKNQLPLFDLYHFDGAHAGKASSIFYYKEGQEFAIDAEIGRRLAVDSNNDFIFQHALVNPDDNSLHFYKLYDNAVQGGFENDGHPVETFTTKTIWREGPVAAPQYSKYDDVGTIINRDAFVNYGNYYWTGADQENLPSYNINGLPEYYVIGKGGISGWSAYNFWTHVSNLRRADLDRYIQATKPIIEFNLILESELKNAKTAKDQLPAFKHYLADLNGSHTQIVSTSDSNNNDAYLQGHLFARVSDLPSNIQTAIFSNTDILESCFDYNNEKYIQGLHTGAYYNADDSGTVYGYKARNVSYSGIGNGALTITGVNGRAYPELITFTYNSATGTFDVTGSVTSTLDPLTIGADYYTPFGYGQPISSAEGCTVRIISGTTQFAHGDQFTIEVLSYVFEQKDLYINMAGVYRTLTSPSQIYNEVQNVNIVAGDVALQNGVWSAPPQLEWNVINETRSEISEGDLYYHLISIIGAQPYLVGSASGNNNWRSLIGHDVGLGGTIKQFDEDTALLVSMLLQEGISTESLIDFARESYQALSTSIRMFVEDVVPTLLTEGSFIPPASGDFMDQTVIDRFKEYFFAQSPIVLATASVVDDTVTAPFYDTTSSLFNLVATLPYLGLGTKVFPQKVYDQDLNMNMMIHHDGHATQLTSYPVELAKKIVQKKFVRSPGQETAGIISGFNFPPKPYAGQFWFKTGSGQLFVFNAVSDDGTLPDGVDYGSYAYDRTNDVVWQSNGFNDWVQLPSEQNNVPWLEVKLDLILQNLELAIEKELYYKCPNLVSRVDVSALEADSHFDSLMATELEKFGVKYGAADVYASAFDSNNSFTWNYSGVMAQGATAPNSTWQDVYADVYGTSRPDLQPWFMANYSTEVSFINALITAAVLPSGTTAFDPTMWTISGFVDFIKSYRAGAGKVTRLSIDFATGNLLPPYVSNNVESLFGIPPGSASNSFEYGSNGPIERFWKKTLDYKYSQQKTYFKIDPLTYVRETWGIKHTTVGEYELNPQIGRKEGPADFILHGETLQESAQPSWVNVVVNTPPNWTYDYKFTCVSRQDGVFKVVVSDDAARELTMPGFNPLDHAPTEATPVFVTATNGVLNYVDNNISVTLTPTRRGFFWGDTFLVTVDLDSNVAISIEPQNLFKAEGFNQLYVQYGRLYGEDAQVSINHSLLNNWVVKLGYRFSGMINTDALTITSQDILVDTSAYNVLLKENQFYSSSWLNGLRVQLVKRGTSQTIGGYTIPAIGPNGIPGEDWIFRVDNYNSRRTDLSWYNYDTAGEQHSFVALDGARTSYQWTRYLTPTTVSTRSAPFLVTGIQNFINFMFGYADKLEADGWRFNDPKDPRIDPDTQRPISYQLLIEQFIVQQFSSVDAGSAFVFNPFYRKVWFSAPHGVVSNLYNVLGFENETTCAVLDVNGKQVTPDNLRVFRQDDMTEMVFDTPVFTLHVLTSEYEHVMLLENYSISTLIYDPFLGQRTSRLFLSGEKQANFSGRLDFGGHFLLGDQMKKNLENSVGSIVRLYDTNTHDTDAKALERAQASMGYQKKDYFKNRGTTDASQFRFWQGMIANKGTNFSINAFANSESYQDARIDEYWAYKVADYGDSRGVTKTEMKVEPSDCTGEYTNYVFFEAEDVDTQFAFDESGFDIDPFGSSSTVDTTGMVVISPNDESRWYSYSDMNQLSYFEADVIAEMQLSASSLNDMYVITDPNGKPVRADCFEIIRTSDQYNDTIVYRELGDYIPGTTNPPEYSAPKFARINQSTIQILDPSLLGAGLTVVAYGPAQKKYSPNQLFNYVDNTLVKNDIIWWDPARGLQHPQAAASIDFDSINDPAIYTNKISEYKNSSTSKNKPWGSTQVGNIWWNTENLVWSPYSDDKINPDLSTRLASWGSLSDMSSIEIYEWVKSSVPPSEAATGESLIGEPAISNIVKRDRTWWQRPVAWRYSANPSVTARSFLTYQPQTMQIIANNGLGIAVLEDGSFDDIGFVQGTKFSAARYASTNKIDANLTRIFGLAKVTSDASVVVGNYSDYINGPYFPTNPNFLNFNVEVDLNVLKFRTNYIGQYVFTNNINSTNGKTYITLTHFLTGTSQALEVQDTPVYSGQQITYNFDKLGITVSVVLGVDQSVLAVQTFTAPQITPGQTYTIASVGTTNFVSIGATSNTVGVTFVATAAGAGTGTVTGTTPATRIATVAAALGSGLIEMFLRSSADVLVPIDFSENGTTYTYLDSNVIVSTLGWVAWNDPTSNPNVGVKPPMNQWQAITGDWIQVGSYLHYLAADISTRSADPWTWFDGNDFTPYKSSWNSWRDQKPLIVERRYRLRNADTYDSFNLDFVFPGYSQLDIQQRASVFLNEKKLSVSKWTIEMLGDEPMIKVFEPLLSRGDVVRVKIDPYVPSATELAFDPTISDSDPYVLTQYKQDYPYAVETTRDEFDNLSVVSYYYWVKNKTSIGAPGKLTTKLISQLLESHDGVYAVPQKLKFYNQLDARPNRYSSLSIKNFGQHVKAMNRFKLRLSKDSTLRENDLNMALKPFHEEWVLLRPGQISPIPIELWNTLTDTLTASTQLDQALPFQALELYDQRNKTAVSYGFGTGQVMMDAAHAIATVKHTIINTQVDKYVNGISVPDYISFTGFDITQLDSYFSNSDNIRKLMSDLWRYAKPTQINEIFFAVLQDLASKNLEIDRFFKTSYISLSDVKTVTVTS